MIKQSQGLWSVETSSGARWAGASLESVLSKALDDGTGAIGLAIVAGAVSEGIGVLFARIPDSGGGQIASGVAGA